MCADAKFAVAVLWQYPSAVLGNTGSHVSPLFPYFLGFSFSTLMVAVVIIHGRRWIETLCKKTVGVGWVCDPNYLDFHWASDITSQEPMPPNNGIQDGEEGVTVATEAIVHGDKWVG